MRAESRVSTQFVTARNAHQVGILVTVGADAPARRAPINVSLVLDRSGSMSGAPLAAAKEAAERFAGYLGGADRLGVVAFDDQVHRYFGPAPAGDLQAVAAIRAIHAGGCTNLSGGWLDGVEVVRQGRVDGTNRVVLLTDGQANAGITEPERLAALAARARGEGVTTTCIGFGSDFNEDLLQRMAQAGGGNFWYIEELDQMTAIFAEEIEGLVALAAQNLAVTVLPTHPAVAGATLLQPYPVTRTDDGGWRVVLGDLYANAPRVLGLRLHVENLATLGSAELARVKVESQVIHEDGVELRAVTLPIVADLDGADHPDPVVESTFLKFELAQAREEAVRRADQGDLPGAASTLREAAGRVGPDADPSLASTRDDMLAEAERMDEREYRPMDRKYHVARAAALFDAKEGYARKIRRRRP